jgi:hypothetical protein
MSTKLIKSSYGNEYNEESYVQAALDLNGNITYTACLSDGSNKICQEEGSLNINNLEESEDVCNPISTGNELFAVYDSVSKEITFNELVDNTSPTIPILTGGSVNWTNVSRTITATASDLDSGIAMYQFYYNAIWHDDVDGSLVFDFSINETISVRAIDNFGNIGAESIAIVKIDKILPVISNITMVYSAPLYCQIDATDGGESGIVEYSLYYEDVIGSGIQTWHTSTSNIDPIGATRLETIQAKVTDGAGNVSGTVSLTISVHSGGGGE